MTNKQHRETAFLRHCLRYDDSAEREALDKSILQIQRDDRCVQRAIWLMALLIGLATAGLGYSAILVGTFPPDPSQGIVKRSSELGLASVISLVVFAGLRVVYRIRLDQRREECRQLVTRLLESRLGKPIPASWSQSPTSGENGQTVQFVAGANQSLEKPDSITRDESPGSRATAT